MGRMLDTLKQGQKSHIDPGVVNLSKSEPDDIPYIEVGDGKKLEGSPDVMKHPGQAQVQPPHPPTEKSLAAAQPTFPAALVEMPVAAATKAINLSQARPMSVVFEPWPALLLSSGVVPEVVAFHQPEHPISQQYATLFTKILESQNGPGTKSIVLCGSSSSVGATTALLNLAVVAAVHDKRRLVLVDAHLMRPALASRLGLSAAAGLQEVMAGRAALEPTVQKTPVAGMYLVPARAEDNSTLGHLCGDALAWVLAWLKDRFDLVLIDGPCTEEMGQTAVITPLCDGMYLVVPQGEITPSHRGLAQSIGRQGGHLRGLIHTHFEM